MAEYSLSDFFRERHACTRKDLKKAVIAAVTGIERFAVVAMFRKWRPPDFNHAAFKGVALSRPEPLTRGQINPNVTEKRKELEALARGCWKPKPKPKLETTTGIIIPPIPQAAAGPAPMPPRPAPTIQSEDEEEWLEIEV